MDGDGEENAYNQSYQNLPNNFSTSPLTVINGFLWSHQSQFSCKQSHEKNYNERIFAQHGGFYDFSNGDIGHANEINFQEPSIIKEQNVLHWNNQEQEMVISSPKNSRKMAKDGTSSTTMLVKGQWTEEEDR